MRKVSIVLICILMTVFLFNINVFAKSLPDVETKASGSNITETSFKAGGKIKKDGGDTITECGIVYSLNINPQITDNKVPSSQISEEFYVDANGLLPGTTYHVRAYAINSKGVAYGDDIAVTTVWIDDNVPEGASLYTSGGDEWIWVTSNPTPISINKTHVSKVVNGNHQHYFQNASKKMTVLTGQVLYCYVYIDPENVPSEIMLQWNDGNWNHRAYWGSNLINWGTDGTNSRRYMGNLPEPGKWTRLEVNARDVGLEGRTVNGMAFTLYDGSVVWDRAGCAYPGLYTPEVLTSVQVNDLTSVSAVVSGNVISDGGDIIIERGFIYSEKPNPSMSDNKITVYGTTGEFSSKIENLTPKSKYYFRAYAITLSGNIGYGDEVNFTTLTYPTVETLSVRNSSSTTAEVVCNVINDGIKEITERGIVYAEHSNPTIVDTKIKVSGTLGEYTASISNLTKGTVYYVRSYATNQSGVGYGAVLSFTAGTATVTTDSVFNIISTGASVSATVVSDNGSPVIERGIVYSKTPNPDLSSAKITSMGTIGSYTVSLTELEKNTTYYVRAYAVNSAGISFGDNLTFSTKNNIWVDDDLPAGATGYVSNDSWNWITNDPPPVSGNKAHKSNLVQGVHQHYFSNATDRLYVPVGATLFTYVYLDPLTLPTEIMLQWNDGSWEHRAYWGENLINWGQDGTVSRKYMGDIPSAGGWIRLEVAARDVGLEGRTLRGMAFTLYSGSAVWDMSGCAVISKPTVVTNQEYEDLTSSSIKVIGTVVADGGSEITECGIIYSKSQDPTVDGTKKESSTLQGRFSVQLTNLEVGSTYYYAAYAKNGVGISYGQVRSFTVPCIPTVETLSVVNVSKTISKAVGQVKNDGGKEIIERGFVYSTDPKPTIDDSKITVRGKTGNYESNIEGLAEGTTYYIRAFAKNSEGVAYGKEISFIAGTPSVESIAVSDIRSTSAVAMGNVVSDGGSEITERGFVISATKNPTIEDTKVIVIGQKGSYSAAIYDLQPLKIYYVRAFATNTVGTSYGENLEFNTISDIWVDDAVPDNAKTSVSGGDSWNWIESEEPSPVSGKKVHKSNLANGTHQHYFYQTTYRLYIPKNANLYTYIYIDPNNAPREIMLQWNDGNWNHRAYWGENIITWGTDGTNSRRFMGELPATGEWVKLSVPASLVGLEGRTINGMAFTLYGGSVYWDMAHYEILSLPEVVTNPIPENITSTSVDLSGVVLKEGSSSIIERGVVYSTSINPTIENDKVLSEGSVGSFSVKVTGLSPNTRYYYRAYAKNANGVGYGKEETFMTNNLPNVITVGAFNTGVNSAEATGIVTDNGGYTILERGIVYSTNKNPTINDLKKSGEGQTGSFTVQITNLQPSTRYYFKAYAINQEGVSYGEEMSLVAGAPYVTTDSISELLNDYAIVNGTVVDDAGKNIIERGFVYSKSEYPTIDAQKVVVDGTIGSFTGILENLSESTTYHFRAYAINENGIGYGEDVVFTTNPEVWVEDNLPEGAVERQSGNDSWNWVTENPYPYSKQKSHKSTQRNGTHQHYFTGAKKTLYVPVGATLYTYLYIFSNAVPKEIMLQWNDSSWNHRAYWGQNLINWGRDGTVERKRISDQVPETGKWVKLSVNAKDVGLEGRILNGMAYTIYDGMVAWDKSYCRIDKPPVVETGKNVKNITPFTAEVEGKVIYSSELTVMERGIVYSTKPDPTIGSADSVKLTTAGELGKFSIKLENLKGKTKYYFRAYAINEKGIGYGESYSFVTLNDMVFTPIEHGVFNDYDDGNVFAVGDYIPIKIRFRAEYDVSNPIISVDCTLKNGSTDTAFKMSKDNGENSVIKASIIRNGNEILIDSKGEDIIEEKEVINNGKLNLVIKNKENKDLELKANDEICIVYLLKLSFIDEKNDVGEYIKNNNFKDVDLGLIYEIKEWKVDGIIDGPCNSITLGNEDVFKAKIKVIDNVGFME